ncbi:basic salivary proline-rich protein 3-like [Tachyglossus aculeatus]|uniref:basic salivary proline-rich protein 3-like n=1 Tax=Tachyglossus aculeatus TaxID=9261 RepID=UPI0018F4CAB1|nr:basic salivary proline-rich protein 3-like [Tachyglossus aculeatus]
MAPPAPGEDGNASDSAPSPHHWGRQELCPKRPSIPAEGTDKLRPKRPSIPVEETGDKLDSEGSRPRWPAPHPNGPVGGTNSTLRAPAQDGRPRGGDKLECAGSRPRCPAPHPRPTWSPAPRRPRPHVLTVVAARRRLLPDVAAPPQGPDSSPTPQPHPTPPPDRRLAFPAQRAPPRPGPARPRPPGPARHFRPPPHNGRPTAPYRPPAAMALSLPFPLRPHGGAPPWEGPALPAAP